MMKKILACLIMMSFLMAVLPPGLRVSAEEIGNEAGESDAALTTDESDAALTAGESNAAMTSDETAAEAGDDLVVREQSAVVQGKKIDYTTTTGLMTVDTAGGACEIFFTAYTLDGVENMAERPITFAFNGGPGSSSEWLHMGFFGPRRIDFDENGNVISFPAGIRDNEYSILDLTDLVFIDPVGTGYSRPVEGVDEEAFCGYTNDNQSVGDFIRLYVSRYNRWASPKYLSGESYGTTRAVGVCEYLYGTYGMGLNGLMLISSANDFQILRDLESDESCAVFLPTYAADAWFHGCLDPEYQNMDLEDFLQEVCSFVEDTYEPALFKGTGLSDEEQMAVAEQLSSYTGLTADYLIRSNLRLKWDSFCMKLLEDRKLAIGRIDGRFTGPVAGGDTTLDYEDPSLGSFSGIFSTAVNQYIGEELGYHTNRYYEPLSNSVNLVWDFPSDVGAGFRQEDVIRYCMSNNQYLKIWVLGGYYDLATPFYSAEWIFNHAFLNEEQKDNLRFSFYPSGHMIYLHEPSLARFRAEAEEWYQ